MATQHEIADLQAQFGIPGIADIVDGNGGLAKVRVHSSSSSGEIYLHGAQVTSWTPAHAEEVFFLSSQSRWEDGHAVRGGIPICFPWFRAKSDDPHAPSHGFVRTKSWALESVAQVGDAVVVTMATASDAGTQKWWPPDFRLLYRVTFGSELTLELTLSNAGSIPARFEEALHCYFNVGSAAAARVRGLDGTHFLDNTRSNEERTQQGDVVLQKQTDNAYMDTESPLELEDPDKRRRIHIAKEDSLTTVVWNPWREGAAALSDLGNEEWKEMLCVEPCNILNSAVTVAPGQQHTIRARIRVTGM